MCANVVRRHQLPREALANGLWVGDVPMQLQVANFLKQMLMAKVRHNFFVAKVSKGQHKLCTITIMFSQPVMKCLAVLFVGPCRPTEQDMKRTPFIVRHNVVYEGLRWLQCNHPDYAEVEVSIDNLHSYSETESPVCLIYRRTDGSTPSESLAVHDLDEKKGTEAGPCSFSMHALTSREFVNMTYQQKIAAALKHFESGGKALAYGHEPQPESIYHNPSLYPGVFPWLFLYGRGAFENGCIHMKLESEVSDRRMFSFYCVQSRANMCKYSRGLSTDFTIEFPLSGRQDYERQQECIGCIDRKRKIG
ncbi:hypothetical protein A0H81_09516, partial [Grifola frondosa]